MFKRFSELFWALNSECLEHTNEDLSDYERNMTDIFEAWTYWMRHVDYEMNDTERELYIRALVMVRTFFN